MVPDRRANPPCAKHEAGNHTAAKTALVNIMHDLEGKEVSLFYFRCMSFDLINTFLRTMNELKLSIPQEYRIHLAEFTTLKQLDAGMTGLIDLICDYVQANKESKNTAMGPRFSNILSDTTRNMT